MGTLIQLLYRRCFARRRFARLNRLLFILGLHGLGFLNHENARLTGELSFLRRLTRLEPRLTVFDIGAHVGSYSNMIRGLTREARIFAFEPNSNTYRTLRLNAQEHDYEALNVACSDAAGRGRLYDYAGSEDGSQHASLYRDAIERFHGCKAEDSGISMVTVDEFIGQNNLPRIHLMKVDTEGHERRVLLGAREAINKGMIDIVQFEFTGLNVISRVFFRDFYEVLQGYRLYRMLPDGLLPLDEYEPMKCEIFAYQNIVAIHKDSELYEGLIRG